MIVSVYGAYVIHATEELVAMLEEPAHDAQHALDVTQTHEAAFVLHDTQQSLYLLQGMFRKCTA